jgi:hypothetical protein
MWKAPLLRAHVQCLLTVPTRTTPYVHHRLNIKEANNNQDNHHDPEIHFVSSYRILLDADDAYTNDLALNKVEQVSLTQKIQDMQDELAELQVIEEAVKTKKKQGEMEKTRLCESLSNRDRALLTFGMELQMTKNKRSREPEGGQEGGGEEDE